MNFPNPVKKKRKGKGRNKGRGRKNKSNKVSNTVVKPGIGLRHKVDRATDAKDSTMAT